MTNQIPLTIAALAIIGLIFVIGFLLVKVDESERKAASLSFERYYSRTFIDGNGYTVSTSSAVKISPDDPGPPYAR